MRQFNDAWHYFRLYNSSVTGQFQWNLGRNVQKQYHCTKLVLCNFLIHNDVKIKKISTNNNFWNCFRNIWLSFFKFIQSKYRSLIFKLTWHLYFILVRNYTNSYRIIKILAIRYADISKAWCKYAHSFSNAFEFWVFAAC